MMTNPCKYCGKLIEYESPAEALGFSFKPNVCNECGDAQRALRKQEEERKRQQERADYFRSICPVIYQETDPARLDQQKLGEVLAWTFGRKGLLLHGETRRGKTRSGWLLLQRLVMEGRSVIALTDGEFGRQCQEAYGEGDGAPGRFFRRMTKCDVLFIDDFGKNKLTERIESELFEVIEHRTRMGLPLILTTNGTKETFARTFSEDRREPIFERLREFCVRVNFNQAHVPVVQDTTIAERSSSPVGVVSTAQVQNN